MLKILRKSVISREQRNLSTSSIVASKKNSKQLLDLAFSEDEVSQPTPIGNFDKVSYKPFQKFIDERRQAAKSSVLVQVKSKDSADDLLKYFVSNFGTPKSLHFHHNHGNENFSSFYIVELASEQVKDEVILNHAKHRSNKSDFFPVYSQFLWLSNPTSDAPLPVRDLMKDMPQVPVVLPTSVSPLYDNDALVEVVSKHSSIDDQILEMFNTFKMSESSEKIRFLCCEQVESSLKGCFPGSRILPFGSSVNSFGKRASDLDMLIVHPTSSVSKKGSRLVFHSKSSTSSGFDSGKLMISNISFSLQNFLPGCQEISHIFHARVPIVKYRQDFLDLDCDLSFQASGYYMSSILYLWGNTDWRVRPLVFAVRKWALEHNLVKSERPTKYFTNFQLTLMVVYFLQRKHKILPSLETLQRLANEDDVIEVGNEESLKYLQDISDTVHVLNKSYTDPNLQALSVSQLLEHFFDFYSDFDYNAHSICVMTGTEQNKNQRQKNVIRERSPIDIINPIDTWLNCSANISPEAVLRFKRLCLETLQRFPQARDGSKTDQNFCGLMHILKPSMPKKRKQQSKMEKAEKFKMPTINDLL